MPSSATITAFYTFVANTKARASQVNYNFSVFRGHILPVEPLTITASNLTHDLGSSEHAWRSSYTQSLSIMNATTTSILKIQGRTDVTAGAADFLWNGVTVGGWISTGIKRESLVNQAAYMTTTALTTALFDFSSTSFVNVTNMSLQITVKGGPVEISLCPGLTSTSNSYLEVLTSTGNGLMNVRVIRDTTTSIVENNPMSFRSPVSPVRLLPSGFRWIDAPGPGTFTYILQASVDATTTGGRINEVRMRAREL